MDKAMMMVEGEEGDHLPPEDEPFEDDDDGADDDEPDEDGEEITREMRQMMTMMRMMEKQRKKELEKILKNQQLQHRKTLKALKPREDIDTSIPLPRKIENEQTITKYLISFERTMKERGTPKKKWTAILPSLLNRKYTLALSGLTEEESSEYDIVKETLTAIDVEDLLMAPQRFFDTAKPQGEDFHQYCQKKEVYWNHMMKHMKTIRQAGQRIVMERFLTFLPHQCAISVRDRKPETVNMAVNYAKEYFAARQWNPKNYLGAGRWADTQNQRRDSQSEEAKWRIPPELRATKELPRRDNA